MERLLSVIDEMIKVVLILGGLKMDNYKGKGYDTNILISIQAPSPLIDLLKVLSHLFLVRSLLELMMKKAERQVDGENIGGINIMNENMKEIRRREKH